MPDKLVIEQDGKRETFVVQVLFQQNSTWQGTITWAEQKKTRNFRSVLEMLKMMNEAMERDEADADSASWK